MSASPINFSGFIQGFRNRVKVPLANVILHCTACHIDEHETNKALCKPDLLEDKVHRRHRHEPGEHAKDEEQIHESLSSFEAQTGKRITGSQHDGGLDNAHHKCRDKRIQVPAGKVKQRRIRKQFDIIIKRPLLGKKIVDVCTRLSAQRLDDQINIRYDPDDTDDDQDHVDDCIGRALNALFASQFFLIFSTPPYHINSSSFFTAFDLL